MENTEQLLSKTVRALLGIVAQQQQVITSLHEQADRLEKMLRHLAGAEESEPPSDNRVQKAAAEIAELERLYGGNSPEVQPG